MKCSFALLPALISLLSGLMLSPAHADESPAAVFKAYEAAVESGNGAAIEAMVAPDATRPPMSICAPNLSDRACMVEYLNSTVVTRHTKLTTLKMDVTGDTVMAKLEVRNDLTRAAGVERFVGTDKVRVKNGKIVDFAFMRDEQDEQTMKFFDYMRKSMGPPPGMPPGGMPSGGMPPGGFPPGGMPPGAMPPNGQH